MAKDSRKLTLPARWTITSLAIHYEGEDLSKDERPFAANILVQLRTDVDRDAGAQDAAASDWDAITANLPGVELIGRAEVAAGRAKLPALEYRFPDAMGHSLQQLVLYVAHESRIYTIAGVHLAGVRFDAIRPEIIRTAEALLTEALGG
jgi:hypothetical protein